MMQKQSRVLATETLWAKSLRSYYLILCRKLASLHLQSTPSQVALFSCEKWKRKRSRPKGLNERKCTVTEILCALHLERG